MESVDSYKECTVLCYYSKVDSYMYYSIQHYTARGVPSIWFKACNNENLL